MSDSIQRSGMTPTSINARLYPALDEFKQHCRRGGVLLIDRIYAEAQALHNRALAAEDLAGIAAPAGPTPKTYKEKIADLARVYNETAAHSGEPNDEEML